MANDNDTFKKIIAHAKEYGFVFPSSEIYDGLSAVYDYGQNGVALKNNIREYWWKSMVQLHDNLVGIDAAIFMHPTTWNASGHVDAFNDPLIDNKDSKKDTVPMFWLKIMSPKSKPKSRRKLPRQPSVLATNLTRHSLSLPIPVS